MAMRMYYPFDFDFSGYSDEQLVKAARSLGAYDREDLISLITELAKRLEGILIEEVTTSGE